MRKFVISSFITSSVILAAIFGLNEDGKVVEVPDNFNSIPTDNRIAEDLFIDNFEFVNLEELKSSSTGLIRMSDTAENITVTESIYILEESIDTMDIDSSEAILID